MEAPAARRQLKAVNVETVELAGIRTLKILVMVNTRKASHVKEAISPKPSTDGGGRAPKKNSDKRQATSSKLQADREATSDKPQASLEERQATSD